MRMGLRGICSFSLALLWHGTAMAGMSKSEATQWLEQKLHGLQAPAPRFVELYEYQNEMRSRYGWMAVVLRPERISPTHVITIGTNKKGEWKKSAFYMAGALDVGFASAMENSMANIDVAVSGDFPKAVGSMISVTYKYPPSPYTKAYVVTGKTEHFERIADLPGPFYIIRSSADPAYVLIWSEFLGWPVERQNAGGAEVVLGVKTEAGTFGEPYKAVVARAQGDFGRPSSLTPSMALAPSFAPGANEKPFSTSQLGVFAKLIGTKWMVINEQSGKFEEMEYKLIGGGVIETRPGIQRYRLDGSGAGTICTDYVGAETCNFDITYDSNGFVVMSRDTSPPYRYRYYPEGVLLGSGVFFSTVVPELSGHRWVQVQLTKAAFMEPDLRKLAQDTSRPQVAFWAEYNRRAAAKNAAAVAAMEATAQAKMDRDAADQAAADAEKAKTWAPALDALRSFNDSLAENLRERQSQRGY